MKKLLAVILAFTVVFSLATPAFASEEAPETPPITEEDPVTPEENVDVDIPPQNEEYYFDYVKDYDAFGLFLKQTGDFFAVIGENTMNILFSPVAGSVVSIAFVVTAPLAPIIAIISPFVSSFHAIEYLADTFELFGEEWDAYKEFNS